MVNICEPLINVVTVDKPKVLIGLNQNGAWDGVAGLGILRPQAITPPAKRRDLTESMSFTWNVVSLMFSPGSRLGDSRAQAKPTGQEVWDAGASERLAVIAKIGPWPTGHGHTHRETVLTSCWFSMARPLKIPDERGGYGRQLRCKPKLTDLHPTVRGRFGDDSQYRQGDSITRGLRNWVLRECLTRA